MYKLVYILYISSEVHLKNLIKILDPIGLLNLTGVLLVMLIYGCFILLLFLGIDRLIIIRVIRFELITSTWKVEVIPT